MHAPTHAHIQLRTDWCSEIGSLWSPDAPELHASVTSENEFHCTRMYTSIHTSYFSELCQRQRLSVFEWGAV